MIAARLAAAALALLLSAAAHAAPACDVDATLEGADARALAVAYDCRGGAPFAVELPAAAEAVTRSAEAGAVSGRYRIDFDALAARGGRFDGAKRVGRSVVTTLPAWMPDPGADGVAMRLRVTVPPGAEALLPLPRDADGRYTLASGDLPFAGYAAFGAVRHRSLPMRGVSGPAAIDLAVLDGQVSAGIDGLAGWVRESAGWVADWFGGFAVPHALIVLVPDPDAEGLRFGRVRAGGGASMALALGSRATVGDLERSWVLVHELSHVHSPALLGRRAWLGEGIATYVEPVLRARAGNMTPHEVWAEFARDMPRGLPALSEESLSHVSFRGIYWGGALFLLLADVEMRRATGNRAGVRECLEAVLRDGGNATARWTVERTLAACDAATGTDVMRRMAARYVDRASPVDLPGLWAALGVVPAGEGVRLDDAAPLAAIRRAIVAGEPSR